MARSRTFDAEIALDRALELFWRKGYEATSLSDLTEAMGIARPSLYACYGNKEALFRKAFDRYEANHLGFVREALAAPTARQVVERLLSGSADVQTQSGRPAGCLGTLGALVCSDAAEPIRRELTTRRRAVEAALAARLERAQAAGELAADADPATLACYVMTLVQGMAVQAASGLDRASLHRVVAEALRGWAASATHGREPVDATH